MKVIIIYFELIPLAQFNVEDGEYSIVQNDNGTMSVVSNGVILAIIPPTNSIVIKDKSS